MQSTVPFSVLSFDQLLTDAPPANSRQPSTRPICESQFWGRLDVIGSGLARVSELCGTFSCSRETCHPGKKQIHFFPLSNENIALPYSSAGNGPLRRPSPMLISLSWPLRLSEQSIGTKLWLLCLPVGLFTALLSQLLPFSLSHLPQMMHLVPSCSPHPPTFDASQLDFDLDLLPGFNDCQVGKAEISSTGSCD